MDRLTAGHVQLPRLAPRSCPCTSLRHSPTVILANTSGKFFSSHCLHLAGSGMYSQYCKEEAQPINRCTSAPSIMSDGPTHLCGQGTHCGEENIRHAATSRTRAHVHNQTVPPQYRTLSGYLESGSAGPCSALISEHPESISVVAISNDLTTKSKNINIYFTS